MLVFPFLFLFLAVEGPIYPPRPKAPQTPQEEEKTPRSPKEEEKTKGQIIGSSKEEEEGQHPKTIVDVKHLAASNTLESSPIFARRRMLPPSISSPFMSRRTKRSNVLARPGSMPSCMSEEGSPQLPYKIPVIYITPPPKEAFVARINNEDSDDDIIDDAEAALRRQTRLVGGHSDSGVGEELLANMTSRNNNLAAKLIVANSNNRNRKRRQGCNNNKGMLLAHF